MKRFFPLLALVLSLPFIAHADEASKRAKAQEMVLLVHSDRMVAQASDNIMKQVSTLAEKMAGANPTPENKAKLADFQKKMFALIDAQVSWKAMEPIFTDLYAQTFTEPELDAILTFYKTPAGGALIQKMPTVSSQVAQFAQSRMATLQPQMRQMFDDFQKSQAPSASHTSPEPSASPAPPTAPGTGTPR